VAWKISGV